MQKLKAFLASKTIDERRGLQTLLEAEGPAAKHLAAALLWNSTSLLQYVFTNGPTYYQIVQSVARRLKIRADDGDSVEHLECEISQHLFKTMWEKMTPEQREELTKKLKEAMGDENFNAAFKTGASLYAALMAANLSGFGVYMLATTVLGALTSTLGLTLPFVAYTAVTRAISVVIGPVGWLGAGLLTLHQLTGPNWQRTTNAIVYISMLRNSPK
jgi:uncharacterized protein YaaW (UPF0174 family)